MAHTKGEWEYDSFNAVVRAGGKPIARLTDLNGEDLVDSLTNKANGYLMAAAPRLLAALDEIERLADFESSKVSMIHALDAIQAIARTASEAARGEE